MSFEEIDIWEMRNFMSRSFTCIQPWFSSGDNSVTMHQKIILNTDIVMKFNKLSFDIGCTKLKIIFVKSVFCN